MYRIQVIISPGLTYSSGTVTLQYLFLLKNFNVDHSPKTVNYWQKTSQFKASCKDLKKLQESWTYKTAKIFSRTRHVRPCSVDVLTNASKVLRDILFK
jgi:hypothetical protein